MVSGSTQTKKPTFVLVWKVLIRTMNMKKSKSKYHFCKIHKQKYFKYLSRCPICRGEEIVPDNPELNHTEHINKLINELRKNGQVGYTLKGGLKKRKIKKSVDNGGSGVIVRRKLIRKKKR